MIQRKTTCEGCKCWLICRHTGRRWLCDGCWDEMLKERAA